MKYLGCDRRARERFRGRNPTCSKQHYKPGARGDVPNQGQRTFITEHAVSRGVFCPFRPDLWIYLWYARCWCCLCYGWSKKVIDKRGIGSVTSIIRCHMIIILYTCFVRICIEKPPWAQQSGRQEYGLWPSQSRTLVKACLSTSS